MFFSLPLYSQSPAQLQKDWKKAVSNSGNSFKLKQERPLFSIGSTNMRIEKECRKEWGCRGGENDWFKKGQFKKGIRVAVLTWINDNATFYDAYVGNKKIYPTDRIIWVTAVPEIKLFCTGLGDLKKTKLRLEQFMGLPYNGQKGKFVTMWVEPRNLFRPCPDAEIFDAKCDTTFPGSATVAHKSWKNTQAVNSFPGDGGYPWTRRGFAYDWGYKNYQGASEYILRAGSSPYIDSIESTEKYCGIK